MDENNPTNLLHKALNNPLSNGELDIKLIRSIVIKYGAPDDGTSRPLLWKLFFNYISCNRNKWKDELNESRKMYKDFEKQLIVNPFDKMFKNKLEEEKK